MPCCSQLRESLHFDHPVAPGECTVPAEQGNGWWICLYGYQTGCGQGSMSLIIHLVIKLSATLASVGMESFNIRWMMRLVVDADDNSKFKIEGG